MHVSAQPTGICTSVLMSLFSFRKPQVVITLQDRGGRFFTDVCDVARKTATHVRSLSELLRLELAEYLAQQVRRIVFFVIAGVMLLIAYLCLCAFACVVLQECLQSWVWAVGIVCLFNLLVGLVALLCGKMCKPGPLAAATRDEIKNDVRCLKILLSDKNENS